jgi:hypothetical protein
MLLNVSLSKMQPILVHHLQLRSYDHLFVTNTANSPCGPNIDHQLKTVCSLCYSVLSIAVETFCVYDLVPR